MRNGMSYSSGKRGAQYVVATPSRAVCDDNARGLAHHGRRRFESVGSRHGANDVPPELTRLNPKIGLAAYAIARTFSTGRAESLRFRLHPWFDHWVRKQLLPGDHIISSYGYANASFRRTREHGGKTFLDGGNSQLDHFWTILYRGTPALELSLTAGGAAPLRTSNGHDAGCGFCAFAQHVCDALLSGTRVQTRTNHAECVSGRHFAFPTTGGAANV